MSESIRFEWDERKAASNQRKHGVSFVEARTVFYDDRACVIPDPDHSDVEDRFVILGISSALRTLVVCHCHREQGEGETIRIISARRADRRERAVYTRRWKR